jgi:hypothetical protein
MIETVNGDDHLLSRGQLPKEKDLEQQKGGQVVNLFASVREQNSEAAG